MNAMKRVGIEYIGDMIDVFVRLGIAYATDVGPRMSSKCWSVVFREIIALDGCPRRDEIEDWLVNWVEKD